jgi:hypothetical protein
MVVQLPPKPSFVIAVVAAGIIAMTHDQVQVRYSVKELALRLVFAFVAANRP